MLPALFTFVIFPIGLAVMLGRSGLQSPYLCSQVAGTTRMHHCFFSAEMGCGVSYGLSCLGWLQTVILLISASWVARIIDVSHCTQLRTVQLWLFCNCLIVVLELDHGSELPGWPVKIDCLVPLPECLIQQLWGRPRMCISDKFLGNADAADPGATLLGGRVNLTYHSV
jgi:hypothetical protein